MHKLEDFENPISGKTDSVLSAKTWWGYILGFLVLIVAFGAATGLVALLRSTFGKIIPAQLLTVPGSPSQSVQPAAPAALSANQIVLQ